MGCCLCCSTPLFMWLIWGGIITDDAKDDMDTSFCRADEFWGQQVAAFIAFSVICVLHIAAGIHQSKTTAEEGGAVEGKAGAAQAAAPKTPCMWAVTLLAFCWNVAYGLRCHSLVITRR